MPRRKRDTSQKRRIRTTRERYGRRAFQKFANAKKKKKKMEGQKIDTN